MKDLKNLKGAKAITKSEQKVIKGGRPSIGLHPCSPGGGEIIAEGQSWEYTTQEDCNGHGIWYAGSCWSCY